MDETATVEELLRAAHARLGFGGDSRTDAEALLSAVIGKSTAGLIAAAHRPVSERETLAFHSLLERRARGEPVAYLLGEKEFWSLRLRVTPDVLIPRFETELLVEEVLARVFPRKAATILELGTGSGAIALALARELPQCVIVATDISAAALEVAAQNLKGNAEESALAQIKWRLGDWFDAVPAQRFDFIVANPPYIAPGDPHLSRGDLRFEPRAALVSPDDGLADLGKIIAGARNALNAGGTLLLEHGYNQGAAVRELFKQNRFVDIITRRDLAGNERVTGGRLCP